MYNAEPLTSALILAGFGLLLTLSVSVSRASAKLGVPVALAFLLVGVAAGSEGIGGIPFENYERTFQIGAAALALILFDGGLNTPVRAMRSVLGPAVVLATAGVVLIAGVTALFAHWLGLGWPMAMLLGAIVSSTDAAAVFSVLSASGVKLRERVGHLLEVESGLNDPMAVILTTALTVNLVAPGTESVLEILGKVLMEMTVGGVIGYFVGRVAHWRLSRMRLPAQGLYPAFTLGAAFLAYGLPTIAHGSGFLGVYVAGVVIGGRTFPHAVGVRRVHDALGWLSQIAMFLILGLLVFPSRLADVAPTGLGIALALAFVARPAVVALCLAPFRLPAREVGYVGWVGLRGAVPIVLATIPVMSGVPDSRNLFDLVFFIVVIGSFLPGSTVPWTARRLGVQAPATAPTIETPIILEQPQGEMQLRSFRIEPSVAVFGASIGEVPLPEGSAITVVERGGAVLAPRRDLSLEDGDGVYVLFRHEDAQLVELMFGPATDESGAEG
jgi:cell volume regulation protein A